MHERGGGANGGTYPGKTVRHRECKGKFFHGFTAILVNKTTGKVLTEEERSHASMIRKQNGNKKTKTMYLNKFTIKLAVKMHALFPCRGRGRRISTATIF